MLVQLTALAGSRLAAVTRVLDEMAHTPSSLLGFDRSFGQLFYGFSVTIGLSMRGGVQDLLRPRTG